MDSVWLQLYSGTLVEHNRLYSLSRSRSMMAPVVAFVGTNIKSHILWEVGMRNTDTDMLCQWEAHLHLSIWESNSILLVDWPKNQHETNEGNETSHFCMHTTRSVSWNWEQINLVRDLTSRLLMPFADVLCLFIEDFANHTELSIYSNQLGLQEAVQYVKPRLLIIYEASHLAEQLLKDISPITAFSAFTSICFKSRQQLKRTIVAECRAALKQRATKDFLFTPKHTVAFFTSACEHVCSVPSQPFDFIKASCLQRPVSVYLTPNLSEFLSHFVKTSKLFMDSVAIMVSALVFDCFPPKSHSKFNRYNNNKNLTNESVLKFSIQILS